jgi:hypothetical protein
MMPSGVLVVTVWFRRSDCSVVSFLRWQKKTK